MTNTEPGHDEDARLHSWRRLMDPDASGLVQAAMDATGKGVEPRLVESLRRAHPGLPVTEALELADARRRAEGRIEGASDLWADRQGIEQASGTVVARWKATRFGGNPVTDLCCGIGGDAIELARRGPCRGLDRDPVRAAMAAANAGIEVVVGDVQGWTPGAEFVHVDPARRDQATGRRRWRLEDLEPGPDELRRIAGAAVGAAIKLGPGLPRPFPSFHERQSVSIVSEHGRLVQAIAWTGELAGGDPVEAVDLPSGRTLAGREASFPTVGDASIGWESLSDAGVLGLVLFHPAVERAGLAATAWRAEGAGVPLRELAAGLGVGFVDLREVDASSSRGSRAWTSLHRIHAVEGPRPDRVARRIEAILGDSGRAGAGGLGRVVVRTRDSAIDVDQWTRRLSDRLRPTGDVADGVLEVHGWRLGRRTRIFVCQPSESGSTP
ncbi:MAG: class I SAM-dependent methyltransferase [Planctomycetota bacterium]|nr:class I SAM-dependent methyltransferase [Planctomycetota bacterium]